MKGSGCCARFGVATALALLDVFIRQRELISNPNRCKNQRHRSGSVAGVRMPAYAGLRDSEMVGWPRHITRCRINSPSLWENCGSTLKFSAKIRQLFLTRL